MIVIIIIIIISILNKIIREIIYIKKILPDHNEQYYIYVYMTQHLQVVMLICIFRSNQVY